jgi:hypothetical protein
MPYVGYSGVANQVNTTDGFAEGVVANNDPAVPSFGLDVGDGGVVNLYSNGVPITYSYIAMEATGVFLLETSGKIQLEVG